MIWQSPPAGEPRFKPFFSSPAISADGKYLVIGQGLHEDADCELLCLETATGKVRWTVEDAAAHRIVARRSAATWSSSARARSKATSTRRPAIPGMVVAVRISDGKELWRAQVNDPESSPAIGDDGTVYIGSGFNGNAVVALRSETDEELKARNLDRDPLADACPLPDHRRRHAGGRPGASSAAATATTSTPTRTRPAW